VNNDPFGLTNTAANAINNTIVQSYTQIENGVYSTFDGTAFSAPIIEFLRCIVGSKVSALEKGLAWLEENLNIRLPRISPDVLKLSAVSITELATPSCKGSDVRQSAPLLRRAGPYHGKGTRVLSHCPQGGGVHVLRFPWRLCALRPHCHYPLDHQIEEECHAEVREAKEKPAP